MRTLVLNADYSYLNICSNFEALVKYLEGKADIVHTYDKVLRSQYLEFKVPAIIVLKKYKDVSKRRRTAATSLKNILIRDNWTCCYCLSKLTLKSGTRDHIIPVALKGATKFSNLVASCKKCNNYKADRTPAQAGMKMHFQPTEMDNSQRLSCYIKSVSARERNVWIDYLKENNITLW